MMSIADVKAEVKARGLKWADVRDCFEWLWEQEREKREHPNAVREYAWQIATSPGCWPFWRHGFWKRWGIRLERSGKDYTSIPRYDLIGQAVASEFPEYETHDGTERLFEFLLSRYDRLPDREKVYRHAMDHLEIQR
jgi:hypothetical protein